MINKFLQDVFLDRDQSTRIFTHVLPFSGYDIPHTCGPNPKVCCQFDFRRGMDSYPSCSWGIDPTPINEDNVHEKFVEKKHTQTKFIENRFFSV